MGNSAARKAPPASQKAMASGDKARLTAQGYKGTADSKEALVDAVKNATEFFQFKYPVKIRIEHDSGLISCRAVFWIWMRHLSEKMKEKWPDAYGMLDKDGFAMHDVVCTLFLGKTKPKKVGKMLIDGRQKTLSSPEMSKGEMVDLLRRIEEWSIGTLGIPLPQPPSEYREAK